MGPHKQVSLVVEYLHFRKVAYSVRRKVQKASKFAVQPLSVDHKLAGFAEVSPSPHTMFLRSGPFTLSAGDNQQYLTMRRIFSGAKKFSFHYESNI
jgi:hypothetical protein